MRALIAFLAAAVVLGAQPQRMVSTSPSITETLFALGLGDRVVAVSPAFGNLASVRTVARASAHTSNPT